MSAAVNAFRKHATQWVMQRAVAPTRTAVRRMGGGHDDHHPHARRRVPESPPPAGRARSSPPADVPPLRYLAPRPRPPPRAPDGEPPPQPTFDGEVFNKTSIGIGVMATVVGGAGVICFAAFFQNKKHGFIK